MLIFIYMYICLYALLTVLNYNACLAFNVHVVNKEREPQENVAITRSNDVVSTISSQLRALQFCVAWMISVLRTGFLIRTKTKSYIS